jgi:hypothetical protein
MEISEVDNLHREAVSPAGAPPSGGWSRRRFLRDAGTGLLVLGGAAVAAGGLASPADAAGLTDQGLAQFAESVELALVAVYNQALASGKLHTPTVVALITAYAGHHSDHAKSLGALAGDAAKAQPNPGVLASMGDATREAPDESHVLQVAYTLENAAAATYLYIIGALTGTQFLGTTASILPVEAEHGAAIGYVLGKDPDTDADMVPPFEITADEIMPATYPIAPGS